MTRSLRLLSGLAFDSQQGRFEPTIALSLVSKMHHFELLRVDCLHDREPLLRLLS